MDLNAILNLARLTTKLEAAHRFVKADMKGYGKSNVKISGFKQVKCAGWIFKLLVTFSGSALKQHKQASYEKQCLR